MLKRLFGGANNTPQRRRAKGPRATQDDIYYCYRLLLNREPDETGLRFWSERIMGAKMPVATLVDAFMSDPEFAAVYFQTTQSGFSLDTAGITISQLDGFSLYLREDDLLVGRAIAAHGYETHVIAALQRLLHPGDVFLDIGANIGYLTMVAASIVGQKGRVIAVEPNPENCLLLRSSVATNGFSQVEVHQCGAGERNGAFVLEVFGSNGRTIPLNKLAWGTMHRYFVFVRSLDELLGDLPRLDVVKIDIEGAEPMAIAGMQKILKHHRPLVVSEFSPHLLEITSSVKPDAYLTTLRQLGYRLEVLLEQGSEPLPDTMAEIGPTYFASGATHIDLLAVPL